MTRFQNWQKWTGIFLSLVFLGAGLAACGGSSSSSSTPEYTLSYSADTGGSLTGDTNQTVKRGEDGTPVEAIPDTNFEFAGWDDGVTDNPRTDVDVRGNISATAIFNENTLTVTGTVIGSGGLQDITVSAGGQATTTDANGFYRLTGISIPENNRLTVNYRGGGRVPASRVINLSGSDKLQFTQSVELRQVDASFEDQDPTQDISLRTVGDDGKANIDMTIQANNLIGAEGNVSATTYYGDPTTAEGRDSFPGDFMAARAEDPEGEPDIILDSVVFMEVTITDSEGNNISEFEEFEEVILRLPDNLQDAYKHGDTIEWWSYDEEKGVWVQEDAFPQKPDTMDNAEIFQSQDDGDLYARAYVSHLSWWNVDVPISDHAVICVYVYDCALDEPLPNIQVEAYGVTYNATTSGTTNSEGRACITVNRSDETGDRERVILEAKLGNLIMPYYFEDPEIGIISDNKVEVFTPREQGSTRDGSGQENWLTLPGEICLSYDGIIEGRVTYEDTGTGVSGFTLYSDIGVNAETDDGGYYEMNVPKNIPVTVYAPTAGSRTVTVSNDFVFDVDFEIANRAPVIESIDRDPTGVIPNGGAVTFTAVASDPDGDEIFYSWEDSDGRPLGSLDTLVWNAPATGTGTETITLTVTDLPGSGVTQSVSVAYGGTVGGSNLKVTVKTSVQDDSPIPGVYVILHGTNNTSVEDYKTTGADGVADFGNIGRETATITLAGEDDWNRMLSTMVEIPVGEFVYYVGDYDDYFGGPSDPEAEIRIEFEWDDDDAGDVTRVVIEPMDTRTEDLYGTSYMDLYEHHIGSDGTLNLLAQAEARDSNWNWQKMKYGWITDRQLTDGGSYSIEMNRDYEGTVWATDAPISSLDIYARRKGVDFKLSSDWLDSQSSGIVNIPRTFPAEQYAVMFDGYGDDSMRDSYFETFVKYSSLPAALDNLPITDMVFQGVDYDRSSGVISWSLNRGQSAPDVINVYFGNWHPEDWEDEEWKSIGWDIAISGNASSVTIPDLPGVIGDWFDGYIEFAEVEATDFSDVDGFVDLVTQYMAGMEPYESSNRILSAGQWADFWEEGDDIFRQPVTSQAPLSGESTDNETRKSTKQKGIPGLLRK